VTDIQIVAIMLVRNEDVFIERVIRNIVAFCDRIVITDHQSTDNTYSICKRLAAEFPHIDLRRITSLVESSDAIAPFYGTNTWVFAVDGDEIFDPVGLREMRYRLLSGEHSQDWNIFANTLNCVKLDLHTKRAWGYLAPPSRAGARLFNFSMITDWPGATGERLHGGDIIFKFGYHAGLRRYLHEEIDWDNSYFRYVHASFLQRSTNDSFPLIKTRLNPDELLRISNEKNLLLKIVATLKVRFSQLMKKDWKNQKYRRGPLVEKDVTSFLG
jgi:glycosyltransferase involved in cell wall biosynthesis